MKIDELTSAAVDEAFSEQVKRLFAVLCENLAEKDANAVARYRRGLGYAESAYTQVSGERGCL